MNSQPLQCRLASLTFSFIVLLGFLALPLRGSTFDYAAIETAIQRGNLAWAQQVLEKRLGTEPRDYQAHMLLGIVLDELNHPADAAQHFQKAVQQQPQSPAAHINLGKHAARVGDLAQATQEFEAAIRISPHDPSGHTNLGLVLMSRGKTSNALAEFQKAAEAAPRDASTWLNLFKCQLQLKQFPSARATAGRILSLASPSAELLDQLGAMQAQAGDYSGAIENLDRSLVLDPHAYETRYNLGLAFYHAGNLPKAITTLEALQKERENAELANLLGEVYEKDKKYLEAVRAFQKAAEMALSNEGYRFDLVFELLAHQNYDAAMLVAQPAVHDFPKSLRLNLALGVAHFARGLYDDSLQDFLRTAREFPDIEMPLYYLALASDASKKDLPETCELVQTYSHRHPDQFWPLYFLGHASFQTARTSQTPNDLRHAESLLKKSIELRASYADSHLDLGNVYFQQELWKEAIKEYERAISLQPDLIQAHFKLYRAYLQVGDSAHAQREKNIRQRLQQQETEQDARQRQVSIFLYKLHN